MRKSGRVQVFRADTIALNVFMVFGMADKKKWSLGSFFSAKSGDDKLTGEAVKHETKIVSERLESDSSEVGLEQLAKFGITSSMSLRSIGGGSSRLDLYRKWHDMAETPFVSAGVRLQVTAALGGHETTGDVVFLEENSDRDLTDHEKQIVTILRADLSEMLNQHAFTLAYQACVSGDAYMRVYTQPKAGVVDLYSDEQLSPESVVPFERGSKTVGYLFSPGDGSSPVTLRSDQMARMKMPRLTHIPQEGDYEKSRRANVAQDYDDVSIVPGAVGGSMLIPVVSTFDDLCVTVNSLVGQRVLDSIDESIYAVSVSGMSTSDKEKFLEMVTGMLVRSKKVTTEQVKKRQPLLERIRHVLPVYNDKGAINISRIDGGQSARNGTVTMEDVMFHAKVLAAGLGTDLSMLGFTELLGGGFGDGGFAQTSAQTAERSRFIRSALVDCFDHICNIHLLHKYGFVVPAGKRPWRITFFGSISALEAERQRTSRSAAEATMLLTQVLQALKDLGASSDQVKMILRDRMFLDEKQAEELSTIVNAGGAEVAQ